MESLQKCEQKGFVVLTIELVQWKCLSLLVSYCSNIPEAQYILTVQYVLTSKIPFARYMANADYIISRQTASESSQSADKGAETAIF